MQDTQFLNELTKCVRCGSCKTLCPTYDEDSTETMVARGRLALLWAFSSKKLSSSPLLNDRIFSCTLCGACSGLCPPGVDIKEVIYHGRRLLRKTDKKRQLLRFLVNFSTKRPKLSYKLLNISQHILFPYLFRRGFLPFSLTIPKRHFKDNMQVIRVPQKKARIAVFTGCTVNFLYPHLGEALLNVLNGLGYEVIVPTGQVCCGTPLRTLGLEKEAGELAKRNREVFSKLNVEAVLSLCPTCTLALKIEYPKFIGEGIDKATDISSFFIDKIDFSGFSHLKTHTGTAMYHDPCHLKYGLGIVKEPREIIKNMGINLIKTAGEQCCGFAGVFCLSYKDLSREMLNKCVKDYRRSDAEMLITTCPGCIMQLSKGLDNKPVFHLIEIMEDLMFQ